jgi:hypothetical protein
MLPVVAMVLQFVVRNLPQLPPSNTSAPSCDGNSTTAEAVSPNAFPPFPFGGGVLTLATLTAAFTLLNAFVCLASCQCPLD